MQGYILQGLRDVATDARLATYLFGILPDEERERAVKWIQENVDKTQVVLGFRREVPRSPTISIVPSSETETEPPVSGIGDEYIEDGTNLTIRQEGTWFEVTYRCLALSMNADACTYLAAIMRQTLLRYRLALTNLGLVEQNISLTDLMPAEDYQDTDQDVFQRGVQISGRTFVGYPVVLGETGVASVTITGTILDNLSTFATRASDAFTRADNSILGRADSGQPWTALSGTWGIVSNSAALLSNGADNRSLAVLQQAANGIVSTVFQFPPGARLAFRFTDKDNGFYLEAEAGQYALKKVLGGSLSTIGTYGTVPVSGDEMKVSLADSSISVFINGAIAIHVSQAFNQSGTLHGVGGTNSTTARFTRFTVS